MQRIEHVGKDNESRPPWVPYGRLQRWRACTHYRAKKYPYVEAELKGVYNSSNLKGMSQERACPKHFEGLVPRAGLSQESVGAGG